MSAAAPGTDFEARIARLEDRLAQTVASIDGHVAVLDSRLHRLEGGSTTSPATREAHGPKETAVPVSASGHVVGVATRARTTGTNRPDLTFPPRQNPGPAPSASPSEALSFGDLVGGHVLAWLGGAATLLGLVLFLALAITHGWIGEEARVLLAGAGSLALMLAGAWLHEHRGRTEAATAMVGTATAGLFATLIVAASAYRLIPVLVAVVASMLVGAAAALLAMRWAGRAIGALGVIGALVSPILLGLPPDGASLAVLAVGCACATWVVIRQRWGWLAIGTTLVCAVQWGAWVLQGQPVLLDLVVLGCFGALGLAGAVATPVSSSTNRISPASAATAVLNAGILAVVGRVALGSAAGDAAGDIWLLALAGVHAAVGLQRRPRLQVSPSLRHLLIAIAVALADVALALSADGLVLSVAWGVAAIGFASMARRASQRHESEAPSDLGVGVHISLVLIQALVSAPPSGLGTGDAQALGLLSVAVLAASCAACARVVTGDRTDRRTVLDGLGLLAVAYVSASALSGPALVVAWTAEGLALAQLQRRHHDVVARVGAMAFIGAGALYTLAFEAPPSALIGGVANLAGAAVALGALATACLRIGLDRQTTGALRSWSLPAAAAVLLYLASVAVVTVFQPTSVSSAGALLDLSVRQEGQVLLSALWSLGGIAALILGLRRNVAAVRTGALALLLITVAKVFLYDLATLTSGYRVASFIVLGLLLLTGAYAYQRLRPPALRDLRTIHPSQR